jgi:crossover junction endodeoxyribonuclease RuvC
MINQAPQVSISALCIAAFDPGSSSGALSFYFTAHPSLITAEDLPVVAGQVDAATLAARLEQMCPDVAVIERVGAMPKQGTASTFKFGTGYGILFGVAAALKIPVHFVAPGVRKRHIRLGADEEEAGARALQLWPTRSDLFSRKKDHGRAEAALLARYFAEVREGRS